MNRLIISSMLACCTFAPQVTRAEADSKAGATDVAFVSIRSGDAHIYTSRGGVDRVLTQGKSINTQPAWSVDGRLAFTSSRNGLPRIYVMNEDGSGQRRLTQDDRLESAASWSPDGKTLAFFSMSIDTGSVDVRIVDVASGKSVTVPGNGKDKGPLPPNWSADGKRFAFTASDDKNKTQIWVVDHDASNLRNVSGKFDARSKAWASMSPDGKRVAYVADMRGTMPVVVSDVETGESKVLTADGPASYESPRWSPDGKQLVVASNRDDPLGARNDIFIVNADGSGVRNLTQNPSEDFDPHWAADGKSIVFDSLRTGTSQLYRVNVGSRETVRISSNPSHDMEPAMRPLAKR